MNDSKKFNQYQTYKEDQDDIYDIETTDSILKQTNLLGISFCNTSLEKILEYILFTVKNKKKFYQILFLDTIKFLHFKRNTKLKALIKKNSIVLSKDVFILWAAKKINFSFSSFINPTLFLLKFLQLCEKKNLSLFILGQSEKRVDKFYHNIKKNFRNLVIIGRQGKFLHQKNEKAVREAIRKTEPNIILMSRPLRKGIIWVNQYKSFFDKSIIIYLDETFDLFTGKKEYIPKYFKSKGLHWVWSFIIFPLNIKKIFDIISFICLIYFKKFTR